jgi:predicted RNase H-like HicB family nuclease
MSSTEGNVMLRIDFEKEQDGRWIAEIEALPGVIAYGSTRAEARGRVEALALRTLADRIEHGEAIPEVGDLFVVAA